LVYINWHCVLPEDGTHVPKGLMFVLTKNVHLVRIINGVSWRWSWCFPLFPWCPMFLLPFCLYCSACYWVFRVCPFFL